MNFCSTIVTWFDPICGTIDSPKTSWIIKQTVCPLGVPPSARLQWNTTLQRPVTGQEQSADWWKLLQISSPWVLSWIIHRIAIIENDQKKIFMANLLLSVWSRHRSNAQKLPFAFCRSQCEKALTGAHFLQSQNDYSQCKNSCFFHVEQRLLNTATMALWLALPSHTYIGAHTSVSNFSSLYSLYLWLNLYQNIAH